MAYIKPGIQVVSTSLPTPGPIKKDVLGGIKLYLVNKCRHQFCQLAKKNHKIFKYPTDTLPSERDDRNFSDSTGINLEDLMNTYDCIIFAGGNNNQAACHLRRAIEEKLAEGRTYATPNNPWR